MHTTRPARTYGKTSKRASTLVTRDGRKNYENRNQGRCGRLLRTLTVGSLITASVVQDSARVIRAALLIEILLGKKITLRHSIIHIQDRPSLMRHMHPFL